MRKTFVTTLVQLAATDPRIILLTGDLGYTVVEPFIEKFPDRFFNIGVAEQNMIGVATGLAEAGFIPFCYTIATFAVLRSYEFIRNGPILHQLPVRIVGVGGGFEYGHAGITHHALEDMGVLRIQPGMTVIAPADYEQTQSAILKTWNLPGPVYYRLGKNDVTIVPGLNGRFELNHIQVIRSGSDLLFITTGAISTEVVATADDLAAQGVEATIALVAGLNPAPVSDLAKLLSQFSIAITVEAHYLVGGLGSLVAEVIAEHGIGCRMVRCGVQKSNEGITGSEKFLNRLHGISSTELAQTALGVLQVRSA